MDHGSRVQEFVIVIAIERGACTKVLGYWWVYIPSPIKKYHSYYDLSLTTSNHKVVIANQIAYYKKLTTKIRTNVMKGEDL